MVYGRRVDGRTLTFGVSGKLWRNSLVLYDRETGTLWSQITGEAVRGPLAGARLPRLAASAMDTTYEDWLRRGLDLKVLSEGGRTTPGQDVYESYHASDETGIRERERTDRRLPQKELVIGITDGERAWALPASRLPKGGTLEVDLGPGTATLEDGPSGVEVSSRSLAPLDALKLYWFVWADFHPATEILSDR